VDQTALLLLAVGALVGILAGTGVLLRTRSRRRRSAPGVEAAGATGRERPPGERLRRGLLATSRRLRAQLEAAIGRGTRPLDEVVQDIEDALIAADVGVRTTGALVARVRERLGRAADPSTIRAALQTEAETMLVAPPPSEPTARPWVVVVTGVNGVGKTTTIGKLAAREVAAGRTVLLVAADTFRAAAIEQLGVWAGRVGADLVRHGQGADPAAVVFDGMKAALARDIDVVLVDTAGRLHTRTPLMDELRKLRRVIQRELPGAPHETLLVLDATTGQNAVSQARTFTEAVQVTGIVLTKLDGTARGGVVLAVRQELGVPIRYIGIGEAIDDLRPFEATEFVHALFGDDTMPATEPARAPAGSAR